MLNVMERAKLTSIREDDVTVEIADVQVGHTLTVHISLATVVQVPAKNIQGVKRVCTRITK